MSKVEDFKDDLAADIDYIRTELTDEDKPVEQIVAECLSDANSTWGSLRDEYAEQDGEITYAPFPVDDGRTKFCPVTEDDYPRRWRLVDGVVEEAN